MTSTCRQIQPLIEAYGDEELATDMSLEVEQHLVDCTTCGERVRLNHAMHLSVRSAVRNAAPVMPSFEERISAALRAEAEREEVVDLAVEREARSGMLSWRTVVPVAAAAALTLVWAGSTSKQAANDTKGGTYATASANADQLLEELVDHHMSARRPQVTEASLIRQFEPEVGVPLNLPSLKDYGARWEGGSVVPVSNLHAASLRYNMGGGRHVTLYVYNSSRVPIETRLQARTVRNEPVYVGSRRGISIAAAEHRGVGYAIASDLNDDESAELVAAVY